MELHDTIKLMRSNDYKERFVAEYWQLKIRYEKLKSFNTKIEAAQEMSGHCCSAIERVPTEPKHDCPADMLRHQQHIMGEYLHILEVRAEIENIDLTKGV